MSLGAHLTDEEIEAQRGRFLSQGHTSSWEHGVGGSADLFEDSLPLLTTLSEPEYGEGSLGLELGSLPGGSRALGRLV